MSRIIAIVFCVAVAFRLILPISAASGDVIYVRWDPTGTGNNGTS